MAQQTETPPLPIDSVIRQLAKGERFVVPADSNRLMRERSERKNKKDKMPYVYRLTKTKGGLSMLLMSDSQKPKGIMLFAPAKIKAGDVLEICWVRKGPPKKCSRSASMSALADFARQ